jgi:hypothetical protein
MTTHPISSIYELLNRQLKATKLFHVICAAGVQSSTLAEVMDCDHFWESVEAAAGTTSTKGKQETRELVLQLLKDHEEVPGMAGTCRK